MQSWHLSRATYILLQSLDAEIGDKCARYVSWEKFIYPQIKLPFFQLKPMFLFLWFCYICGFVLGYSSWMNQIDCYSIQHISIFKRFRICVKFFKPRLLAWKMLKNSSPTAEGWRYRIKVFGIALQCLWVKNHDI